MSTKAKSEYYSLFCLRLHSLAHINNFHCTSTKIKILDANRMQTTNNHKTFSTKLIYDYFSLDFILAVCFCSLSQCNVCTCVRVSLCIEYSIHWSNRKMHCITLHYMVLHTTKHTESRCKSNHNNMGGLKG